ncbi:hypothetical protein Vafri_20045 [Volvox africanus]|uniref:Uncharacterized protein n=1 Tax=Volvox africanus TaxID=51714 RepID=A0A8J4BW64_9CHLO|nr:hypothetical protein Vafri_20045 [Volvox africanus]
MEESRERRGGPGTSPLAPSCPTSEEGRRLGSAIFGTREHRGGCRTSPHCPSPVPPSVPEASPTLLPSSALAPSLPSPLLRSLTTRSFMDTRRVMIWAERAAKDLYLESEVLLRDKPRA